MVINDQGSTVWKGRIEDSNYTEFFFAASQPGNVGVVAATEKAVRKSVDRLNLARIQEERMKREHRKRR